MHNHPHIGPCRTMRVNGFCIHLAAEYPKREAEGGPVFLLVHGGLAWA